MTGKTGKKLRSREWFNNLADPEMTALYLERYLNYGLTLEELRGIATEPTDPGSINAIERYNPVDVWTGAALSAVTSANPWVEKGLAPHNSTFVIFMPETVH